MANGSKFETLKALSKKHPALRMALSPAVAARRWLSRGKRTVRDDCHERLVQLLAEDPVLKVPEFDGEFVVGASSDIFKRLLFQGSYEPTLVNAMQENLDPKRDVIDVGANVGFFSVLLAKTVGPYGRKVLAIEPTPNALRRLKANLLRNEVDQQVTVFEGVASEHSGSITLNIVEGKEEYSSLAGTKHPKITGHEGTQYQYTTREVKAQTIDQLVASFHLDPGFIKIDVEGAENRVLAGAHDTLAKKRPVILSELCDYLLKKNGSSAEEVVRTITQFDYTVIDPVHPTPIFEPQDFGDMLCIPNECV